MFLWRSRREQKVARFFNRTADFTNPTRYMAPKMGACAFCSQRAVTTCEYAGCGAPICYKCTTRKGGGHLCRRHKDARLVQFRGKSAADAENVRGGWNPKFKAKKAVPHF